jgi:hypothetical protein
VELLFVEEEVAGRETPATGNPENGTGATGHPETDSPGVMQRLDVVDARLQRMETLLDRLVQQRTVKDWYGIEEVAQILGRAEFTVREWARLGRVRAEKRGSGRGKYQSWVISHAELERIQRQGLLPIRPR